MAVKKEKLKSRIVNALNEFGFRLSPKALNWIAHEAEQELRKIPRIAILGETGVGKSSTLNALFNAGAAIDHIAPCTQETSEYVVVSEYEAKNGVLRIYDMPGIGQDVKSDSRYLEGYTRVLSDCEVALWILDAGTRTLSQVEHALREVVAPAMSGFERLVIGLNKADNVEPGNWNLRTNMPSREQKSNIESRINNVRNRLGETLGATDLRIVAYSAKRHYRLGELVHAVIDACPSERRWILHDQVALASFEELVDPSLLDKIKLNAGEI